MHINPDHFLETDAGRVTTPERNKLAWTQCFQALDTALLNASAATRIYVMIGSQGAGKSRWAHAHRDKWPEAIIFDAILVTRSERKPIIDAANARRVPSIAV